MKSFQAAYNFEFLLDETNENKLINGFAHEPLQSDKKSFFVPSYCHPNPSMEVFDEYLSRFINMYGNIKKKILLLLSFKMKLGK